MKKNKVIKIDGVRCAVPIQKKTERPLMPRPVIFRNRKSDYNRQRLKQELRGLCDI